MRSGGAAFPAPCATAPRVVPSRPGGRLGRLTGQRRSASCLQCVDRIATSDGATDQRGTVAAIVGKPNFNDLTFGLGSSTIYYGRFITAVINFLIIAATLFVIIRSFEAMQRRRGHGPEDDQEEQAEEVVLLTEIRDLLRTRV